MEFQISDELRKRIERIFKENKIIRDQLLSGNEDIIREIGILSHRGIDPKDIIKEYENGKVENIYKKAKKLEEMQEIYTELCNARARNNLMEER